MNRTRLAAVVLTVIWLSSASGSLAYVNGVGKAAWARMTAAERRAYERGGLEAVKRLRGELTDAANATAKPRPAATRPDDSISAELEAERLDALGRLAAGRGTDADRARLARWRAEWQTYERSQPKHTQVALSAEQVAALRSMLQDRDEQVRHRAAFDLRYAGTSGQAAIPQLLKALDDSDADVRQVAAGTLGEIGVGSRDVVRALAVALADPKPAVRRCAATSLRKLLP